MIGSLNSSLRKAFKMKPIYNSVILLAFVFLLSSLCCNKKSITESKGPVTFTVSPIEYDDIRKATPLGNLNPPDHTFPTNHIGFYLNGSDLVEVRAYADGKITTVYSNTGGGDFRIEFKHTSTFYSYLDHVENLTDQIVEGEKVEAGDLIGYGNPATGAVDMGVVDYDTTRNFIVHARYHEFYLHCGNPYLYFSDEIRNALLDKNPRTVEPRGGKIDFDIDGTLSGNWFLEGTPLTSEAASYIYSANQLAFVYDDYDPSIIRITCGGTLAIAPFDRRVVGNTPSPKDVNSSSGMVKYELSKPSPFHTPGILLVEMLESRRIRVEVFPNKTKSEVTGFTGNAKIYIR